MERARLHLRPEQEVPALDAERYRALVARRAERVPLPYLTGIREFWSMRFEVTPAVLIPRPETEALVETFLRVNRRVDPVVLDVGTGAGCLAIAVAREVQGARLHATDISPEALEVARRNAAAHGVSDRIAFHRGDLFTPLRGRHLEGRCDCILSNPPYVGEEEIEALPPEVRDHEPRRALSPGPDPLAVHRRLAAEAAEFLEPGGHLVVEIGHGQERPLRDIYARLGGLRILEIRPDLAGIPRALLAVAVAPRS